jgi:hypothetical protein
VKGEHLTLSVMGLEPNFSSLERESAVMSQLFTALLIKDYAQPPGAGIDHIWSETVSVLTLRDQDDNNWRRGHDRYSSRAGRQSAEQVAGLH